MHIIIGIITAVAGLIWAMVALQRAGINLGAFNPFLLFRRLRWNRKYSVKPIYNLDKPLDVAAMLLLAVIKCEGEISAEQKQSLRIIYQNDFHLSPNEADDILLASAHLLRDEIYVVDNLSKILERSANAFSPEQVSSLLGLMRRVSTLEGPANDEQLKLIRAFEHYFDQKHKTGKSW